MQVETVLKREVIRMPEEGDLRVELGKRAEALLGYSVLRKDAKVPGALAKALHELGIEPFSKLSVDAYKDNKLNEWKKLNPNGLIQPSTGSFDSMEQSIRLQMAQMQQMQQMQNSWGGLGGFGRAAADFNRSIKVISWSSIALRGYSKPVPEFAIQRAVTIKEYCPGVEFFVEELKEESRTLDPFLIARLDDEQFYIDVWDEPEFEKALNQ